MLGNLIPAAVPTWFAEYLAQRWDSDEGFVHWQPRAGFCEHSQCRDPSLASVRLRRAEDCDQDDNCCRTSSETARYVRSSPAAVTAVTADLLLDKVSSTAMCAVTDADLIGQVAGA